MYYRSGTGAAALASGRRCMCTHRAAALFCVIWHHGCRLEIMKSCRKSYSQSMRIYLKNNPAKFHPDLIWNDEDLGFLEEVTPTRRRTRWVAIWDQYLIQKSLAVIDALNDTVIDKLFIDKLFSDKSSVHITRARNWRLYSSNATD